TTSMITPPLSISARPVFTLSVPTSAIAPSLAAEEGRHLVSEAVSRLDEDEVAGAGEDRRRGTGYPGSDLARAHGARDEVELAGEAGERAGEDEPPDPLRVCRGVLDRDRPAVGVAEEVDAFEPEVSAQLLDVGCVVLDRVGAVVGGTVRAARPPRVDQHERAA